ncbi:MAG: zf-TFIIB domain-containing protein [Gammaproteobacteria bacterium]|nr:zf-TFIIB domain-containing protein [Gammaproteobacteria bacterium]
MDCPACQSRSLSPAKVTSGLPGFACNRCGGSLIELLAYRMWAEQQPASQTPRAEMSAAPPDTTKALVCPKCSKLMAKYRIDAQGENHIDLCGNCGRFWLDGGEWGLLESLNLQTGMTAIFNAPWQASIRKGDAQHLVEARFQQELGAEAYQQARVFRDWLNKQPDKQRLLDYLARDD